MVVFQVINNIAINSLGGGAELFAIRLNQELQLKINTHLVIVWRNKSDYEESIIDSLKQSMDVHFLSETCERSVWNYFVIIKNFLKLISNYSPKIINSHSAFPDLLNSFQKFINGKKIHSVRTVHTDKNWFRCKFLEFFYGELLFPFLFDLEIAISRATKERLDCRYVAKILNKKSKIINNGISQDIINKTQKITKINKSENSETYKIITVGRLSEQKGYVYLLEAISLIRSDYDFALYIFGEGPEKEALIKTSKALKISNNVKFLGFRPDVLDFMSHCDIFVSSSLWEGFPTVILEAMALGVPVVATDVSGSRELIRNNFTGILVPPKHPKKLADAIIRLMNFPEEASVYVENAYNEVLNFSIENIAEKYLKSYTTLVEKANGNGYY